MTLLRGKKKVFCIKSKERKKKKKNTNKSKEGLRAK